MSAEVDRLLGVAKKEEKIASADELLKRILAESKKQTGQLSAIRWLLVGAWLMLLVGGVRIWLQR